MLGSNETGTLPSESTFKGHQAYENCPCEAARVNTMTGGLDLSFGCPQNGKIPYPPSGNLEPANQYAPSKKQRES